jgi:hypothetical protein
VSAEINEVHLNLVLNSSFVKNSKPDAVVDSGIVVLGLLSYMHSKEAY